MQYIESRHELTLALRAFQGDGKRVALVPTMGALHKGHISLVEQAKREGDIVVVSVFVNPTQFNNPQDLQSYPRTLELDRELLAQAGVGIMFAPTVEEMYPEPDTRQFSFPPLDQVMEGVRRPGHFNGVAQIVSKLFMLVNPECALFGKKDYQQLLIIERLVQDLQLGVRIVRCETYREPDGLAVSSRNALLTPEARAVAPAIRRTLLESASWAQKEGIEGAVEFVTRTIDATPGLKVEYFTIADRQTLQPQSRFTPGLSMGFIAVQAGAVRLIDNIEY